MDLKIYFKKQIKLVFKRFQQLASKNKNDNQKRKTKNSLSYITRIYCLTHKLKQTKKLVIWF